MKQSVQVGFEPHPISKNIEMTKHGDWEFQNLKRELRYLRKRSEIRCLNPFARCQISGRFLFLRKCIKDRMSVAGPAGEPPVFWNNYYDPVEFACWVLVND